jgi:hypothetical protein
LLYAALSHAAPASAADDMNAGQTDRKVIQMGKGEQDKMKGVGNTGKPIDQEKEIKQNELGEIKK